MSIAAALAYEEGIKKLMRLMAREEALRAPTAILVNSNSTLEWAPIPPEPNPEFQEMMQRMRHRVAQEMAVPANMFGAPRPSAQEVQQRQQEQMMRLQQDQSFLNDALLKSLGVNNDDLNELLREAGKGPSKVEEPAAPVVKKYGRMLEP